MVNQDRDRISNLGLLVKIARLPPWLAEVYGALLMVGGDVRRETRDELSRAGYASPLTLRCRVSSLTSKKTIYNHVAILTAERWGEPSSASRPPSGILPVAVDGFVNVLGEILP